MKKNITIGFFTMLLIISGVNAQITLTATNTPKAEYQYTFQKIQIHYSDLFAAGADIVWDISGAVFAGDTAFIHFTQDTAFDPFPDCCMSNELHNYLNNLDHSYFQDNGVVYQVADTAFLVAYEKRSDQYTNCFVQENKSYPIMIFPFEYGSVNDKPVNMEEKHVVWKREGDAWGTLICPDTTYMNVLRVKTTDSTHYQPMPGHPSGAGGNKVTYEWFTADSDVPILKLEATYSYYWWDDFYQSDHDTTALLFQSKTYLPLDSPSIVIVPENDIVVFPNPATNFLTICGNDTISEFSIYNVFGQGEMHFSNISADKTIQIDLANVNKGVYLVSGKYASGGTFSKRFVVVKE